MRKRGRPPADDVLTPAEWRVAEGVRHGLSNPQIATRLDVGVDAVKYHVGNALQKLGFARRAELQRWNGVRRASAMARREGGMRDNGPIGLGQVARQVGDLQAATAWYRHVLGLPHLFSFGQMAFFDCDGTRLMLAESAQDGAPSLLYFRVDDIHGACAALQARGAALRSAPHLIHTHDDGSEEWMAFIDDNEGRPLGLMARVGGVGAA